jgi:hypothetical protein
MRLEKIGDVYVNFSEVNYVKRCVLRGEEFPHVFFKNKDDLVIKSMPYDRFMGLYNLGIDIDAD